MSVSSTRSSGEELDELESVSWYHYDLSRHAAEALLLSNGVDGNFLLRNSNKGPDCFALSVRAKDSVKHFHVRRQFGRYAFGFNEFPCLQDFCSHLANQPLLGSETGNLIVLRFPYPRQVEEPSIYETVCVHTAMQTGRHENDLVPNAPAFVEPIRTLDLTECSAVQFDYSQERVNCFCLVFPERTFYLCAKSGAEADEWIKILRWKLVSRT
ncbi:Dual adapter for phosphotyrosine and 3-phosphotyrosine and 3-phosphoinositide [Anabarilius grahami]|uniref:Dual adapter for phosphotyrosine and 3-phosphotyrosine and 3-phosphoinositide n=1 Tax=Anabarilius grahami TaxID=495550 RepID=A0A3N0XX37_ANAGA|nr:Dual adapter for phosphotyrosine and 3-phosphotyrosine and 3-phosphoinositide [Anabarilius grahami]